MYLSHSIFHIPTVAPQDIINLNLPRAVPLAYQLDANLKPVDRPDGRRDEATGYLRGVWLGGDQAVKEILDRDHKQVYDTTVKENLEIGEQRDKWNRWMEFIIGQPTPGQKALGAPVVEEPSGNRVAASGLVAESKEDTSRVNAEANQHAA